MIRGIFWDNDGVLVDTEGLYYRASAEALGELGIELSREEFIERSLRQGESVFALAAERGHTATVVRTMQEKRNDRYAALLAEGIEPLRGVEEVLRALHGRMRMAVVTSSRRRHFEIIHRHTGLLPYFDFVLTREDYHHAKPDPEPYLSALERSGLLPEECLVVEDTERGLRAAVAAGLRCLVVPGELTAGGDFTAATAVLAGIHEIPKMLSTGSIF
ncbi:MAG TPA: HAD family phosphatase [Desulfuromonadales bacterium]|nr:HAD family phosphatase [Desulfuromonadales bacterium]